MFSSSIIERYFFTAEPRRNTVIALRLSDSAVKTYPPFNHQSSIIAADNLYRNNTLPAIQHARYPARSKISYQVTTRRAGVNFDKTTNTHESTTSSAHPATKLSSKLARQHAISTSQ